MYCLPNLRTILQPSWQDPSLLSPTTSFSRIPGRSDVCLGHVVSWILKRVCVLVPWGCCNKVPHTGGARQWKFILSWFWRLQVQKQRVGVAGPSKGSRGGSLLTPSSFWGPRSSLAWDSLTLISASTFPRLSSFCVWESPCLCITFSPCVFTSSFYEAGNHIGSEAYPTPV